MTGNVISQILKVSVEIFYKIIEETAIIIYSVESLDEYRRLESTIKISIAIGDHSFSQVGTYRNREVEFNSYQGYYLPETHDSERYLLML